MLLPSRGPGRHAILAEHGPACSASVPWLFAVLGGLLLAGSVLADDAEPMPEIARPLSATDIRPAPLKEQRVTVNLPAPVQNVCIGGGGRYLILHLPQQHKLAVFDCNRAKIVKYLPSAEDTIFFTAGLDKLFVALPGKRVIQRWDLKTFAREAEVPVNMSIKGLAMGSATREPLVLQNEKQDDLVFLDPVTLKQSDYSISEGQSNWRNGRLDAELRVSANGDVITGRGVLLRMGTTYKPTAAQGDTLPSPDGRALYKNNQISTPEGKAISQATGTQSAFWFMPAVQGPYVLSYRAIAEKRGRQALSRSYVAAQFVASNGPIPTKLLWSSDCFWEKSVELAIHWVGRTRQLVTLPEIDGMADLVDRRFGVAQPIEGIDRHFFFMPEAKLLVFIPISKENLVLCRTDVEQLLDKADTNYLYVKSVPPPNFQARTDYQYQIAVCSRKGGVKYRLDAGPDKMTLSPEGLLTWHVPADFADKEVSVIITVSDKSGEQTFHTFTLRAANRAAENKPEQPKEEKGAVVPVPQNDAAKAAPLVPTPTRAAHQARTVAERQRRTSAAVNYRRPLCRRRRPVLDPAPAPAAQAGCLRCQRSPDRKISFCRRG